MGSCSSVQKYKNPSAMPSQVKEKSLNGEKSEIVMGSNYSLKDSEFGSQAEVFFDSHAWIDSDCEDDFFSVNGDFTPSRGTTPNNNPTITLPRQSSEKSFTFDLRSDPSPTGRKRLSELFQRTADQMDNDEQSETNHTTNHQEASKQTAPSQSHDTVRSLVLTPSRDSKHERKMKKTADCCLPSFRFSDKQQRLSSVNCRA